MTEHTRAVEGAEQVAAAPTTALADEVVQLRQAVTSCAEVGVVKGLLAGRYCCSTEQAWSLLVRLSQSTNIKVRYIAEVLKESFDGHALTEQQTQTLTTVLAKLPAGTWPRRGNQPAPPR